MSDLKSGTRVTLDDYAADDPDNTLRGEVITPSASSKAPDEEMVLVDWNTGLRCWEYAENLRDLDKLQADRAAAYAEDQAAVKAAGLPTDEELVDALLDQERGQ